MYHSGGFSSFDDLLRAAPLVCKMLNMEVSPRSPPDPDWCGGSGTFLYCSRTFAMLLVDMHHESESMRQKSFKECRNALNQSSTWIIWPSRYSSDRSTARSKENVVPQFANPEMDGRPLPHDIGILRSSGTSNLVVIFRFQDHTCVYDRRVNRLHRGCF